MKVTCHLWHLFFKMLGRIAYFWFGSSKIHGTFFGSLLELPSHPIHPPIHPYIIDFQDSVMMISLIWPLRGKGGLPTLGGTVDLHFLLGSYWFEGSWKMGPISGGIKCMGIGGVFKHFFIFNPENSGDDPIWQLRICFQRCCETTIQLDNWTPPSQQKLIIFFSVLVGQKTRFLLLYPSSQPWRVFLFAPTYIELPKKD